MIKASETKVNKWLKSLPLDTKFSCHTDYYGYKRVEYYSVNGELRLILDLYRQWPKCVAYIKEQA